MSTPDTTADIAAQKIAEIDKEIEAIEAQINAQVAALIARKDSLQRIKEALNPLVQNGSVAKSRVLTVDLGGAPSAPTANTGFRSAVRGALRGASPKGLKPAELIKALETRGDLAKYTGKVKPADRVYAELYALKQSGEITKRYGRYVYNVENVNGQT